MSYSTNEIVQSFLTFGEAQLWETQDKNKGSSIWSATEEKMD